MGQSQSHSHSTKNGYNKRNSKDLSIAEVNKILSAKGRRGRKKVRFAVPDDSDDTINSSKE